MAGKRAPSTGASLEQSTRPAVFAHPLHQVHARCVNACVPVRLSRSFDKRLGKQGPVDAVTRWCLELTVDEDVLLVSRSSW